MRIAIFCRSLPVSAFIAFEVRSTHAREDIMEIHSSPIDTLGTFIFPLRTEGKQIDLSGSGASIEVLKVMPIIDTIVPTTKIETH